MDKVEKYYQYVIKDLVKDPRIDYEEKRIYLLPLSPPLLLFPLPIYPSSLYSLLTLSFSSYVEGRYGLKGDEVNNIWDLYKERIKEIIE